MELPRALSGSKELMARPGVASTWTVATRGSATFADWAVAEAPCARIAKMAIATADSLRSLPAIIRPRVTFVEKSRIEFPRIIEKKVLRCNGMTGFFERQFARSEER